MSWLCTCERLHSANHYYIITSFPLLEATIHPKIHKQNSHPLVWGRASFEWASGVRRERGMVSLLHDVYDLLHSVRYDERRAEKRERI